MHVPHDAVECMRNRHGWCKMRALARAGTARGAVAPCSSIPRAMVRGSLSPASQVTAHTRHILSGQILAFTSESEMIARCLLDDLQPNRSSLSTDTHAHSRLGVHLSFASVFSLDPSQHDRRPQPCSQQCLSLPAGEARGTPSIHVFSLPICRSRCSMRKQG